MKAWRKHNMEQAAKVKHHSELAAYFRACRVNNLEKSNEEKAKQANAFKLRTKHERRTHFAAEVATPSQNLYLIMAHAGLPVPEEFMTQVVMAARKHAARSTASNPGT